MKLTNNVLTWSAVGLITASFCRQSSMNEQNSDEKRSLGGVGVASYNICHDKCKGAKVKEEYRIK